MPELPEVETIMRGLRKVILDKIIMSFDRLDKKVVRFGPKEIEGSKIKNLNRRAKILVVSLDNGKSILVHLKMTGQLIYRTKLKSQNSKVKIEDTDLSDRSQTFAGGHPSKDWWAELPNKFTRAIFHFDDGSVLFFNDLRRFGYMKLYDSITLDKTSELVKLGPEPFSNQFTPEYLIGKAKKIPNRKIKQFITDQEIVAGVGNIYVDETLFYSKISPTRPVKEIKLSEWKTIHHNIKKVLELGIKSGGSSEDTYVDAFGNQGSFTKYTKVYRKTGQPCPNNCGDTIKRITLGSRGTHFCPTCQK
jgi:formamidopyrimidine-DNA glycosylase